MFSSVAVEQDVNPPPCATGQDKLPAPRRVATKSSQTERGTDSCTSTHRAIPTTELVGLLGCTISNSNNLGQTLETKTTNTKTKLRPKAILLLQQGLNLQDEAPLRRAPLRPHPCQSSKASQGNTSRDRTCNRAVPHDRRRESFGLHPPPRTQAQSVPSGARAPNPAHARAGVSWQKTRRRAGTCGPRRVVAHPRGPLPRVLVCVCVTIRASKALRRCAACRRHPAPCAMHRGPAQRKLRTSKLPAVQANAVIAEQFCWSASGPSNCRQDAPRTEMWPRFAPN